MSFCNCFGRRRRNHTDADTDPLLPRYDDETSRQRLLHQKLHSYQQLRALSQGYMPSTEQAIANLRTLLASDLLRPDPDRDAALSPSGRRVVRYTRIWLQQFSELVREKNESDQLQDLIWCLSRSRVSVDVEDLAARAKDAKGKADVTAAWKSLKTVGELALTNDDFRTFLADLNVVGREVVSDSAAKMSSVATDVSKQVEPDRQEQDAVATVGEDGKLGPPSEGQLRGDLANVGTVVAEGSAEVAREAVESAEDKLTGDEGKVMLNRLKKTVLQLRQSTDYSQSVSTLSRLVQRYALVYSRAASEVIDVAAEDTNENEELDRAMRNGWELLKGFGDRKQWEKLEEDFHRVMTHQEHDAEFENLLVDVGNSLQQMLMDPAFFDDAQGHFDRLQAKHSQLGKRGGLRDDVDQLLVQTRVTLQAILHDTRVHGLLQTTQHILLVLFPPNRAANPDLIQDTVNTFIPILIAAVQHLPIPRLELSTPSLDLLLENLILEPGDTINRSSFLPYAFKLTTHSDLTIRKTPLLRTTTSTATQFTVTLRGLSLRATDIGYWLRTRPSTRLLPTFTTQGLASLALDESGLDMELTFSLHRNNPTLILELHSARAHLHKLTYTLSHSRWSTLLDNRLLKPLLFQPLIRSILQTQITSTLTTSLESLNTHLLFLRERLRATRIASPESLHTFLRAIIARFQPDPPDPDTYIRVGVAPPTARPSDADDPDAAADRFRNVFAPGSIVKVWRDEGAQATERIESAGHSWQGWRNAVFDVQAGGQ